MPNRIPTHKPHRLPGPRSRYEATRPNAAAMGYCDKRHRAWRRAVLTRDGWQCRACGRICSGYREAHADHILPIADGGDRYDLANGQCLCVSCHSRKTRAENAGKPKGTTTAPATATPAPPPAWPEYR